MPAPRPLQALLLLQLGKGGPADPDLLGGSVSNLAQSPRNSAQSAERAAVNRSRKRAPSSAERPAAWSVMPWPSALSVSSRARRTPSVKTGTSGTAQIPCPSERAPILRSSRHATRQLDPQNQPPHRAIRFHRGEECSRHDRRYSNPRPQMVIMLRPYERWNREHARWRRPNRPATLRQRSRTPTWPTRAPGQTCAPYLGDQAVPPRSGRRHRTPSVGVGAGHHTGGRPASDCAGPVEGRSSRESSPCVRDSRGHHHAALPGSVRSACRWRHGGHGSERAHRRPEGIVPALSGATSMFETEFIAKTRR